MAKDDLTDPPVHGRKRVKLRIPAIVTADGKWAASGSHSSVKEPDWAGLDEMCDIDNPTISPQRHWIEVEIDLPEIKTAPATAVASAD